MLLWIVFSIVILFTLIALLIQTDSFQNWSIDKITSYLNSKGKFKTDIDQIHISWWDALEISGFEVRDHRDSILFQIEKASVDFELSSVLASGNPSLDAVRLEQAQVNLFTHEGDSIMNLNRWIGELTDIFGSGSSQGGSKFEIGTIEIRKSGFSLVNYNSEPIQEGLDYNKMRFSDVVLSAEDFYLENGEVGIKVGLLTGMEYASGLEIKEFKTNYTFSPEMMEFDKLSIITNNSYIKNYLRFEYASTASLSDFVNKVAIIARMDETVLGLKDLHFFAPSLPDIDHDLVLTGEVTGPIADMKSDEFLLRLGQKTEIFGSFLIDGLPNIEETYLNLSLKNSTVLAKDLDPFLSPEIQKELKKFNTIRLNADFAGLLSRFTTNGEFKTSIGNLTGRVYLDRKDGVNTIVSKVSISDLDLGIITDSPELLQKVSLDGNVNIQGSNKEDILIGLDAAISEIGINNYTYKNINTDAEYGLDLFKGNISIQDPNLKMIANGAINLRDTVESINIKVQLDTANLGLINLSKKQAFLSGNLEMDTQGIKIDDLTGIARFKNIKIGYEDRFLDLGDFFFQSLFAGGTRSMSLNSDYLVAGASGHFELEQMYQDLKVLFSQYLAILINEEQPIADLSNTFSQAYNLDLNVRMIDINPLLQLFQPDFKISKNTILEGAFYQTSENTVFNFFTSIDTLTYKTNSAREVNIDFNTSKIINSDDILASFYVFSKAQNLGQDLEFNDFGFEAIWNENVLDLELAIDQDSTQSEARILAYAQFSNENTKLIFKDSDLKVLNRTWEFDPENQITIRPGEITFENVRLNSEDQEIDLEGRYSNRPGDLLTLLVDNVNMDLLNTLTPLEFLGRANGELSLSNSDSSQRTLDAVLKIDDLKINDFPIGNLSTEAHLNDSTVRVSLENFTEGKRSIFLSGDVYLENFKYDLQGELRDAEMVIFEPFLANYLSDMGGTVTGDLKLSGTALKPILTGYGAVSQGKLKVNFLNTNYQLDGRFLFEPGEVSFDQLVAKDINGNTASLNGGLTYQGIEDIVLNINSRMNNFQVLNTTILNNEVFYGNAFVTGTLDIIGSTSNLDINARATSQPNTRIYIPLSSSDEQTSEDFIHFINVSDTLSIQGLTEEINRLDIKNVRMNFVLDVTPDAYTEIIIDPRTEEKISGRGQGILTMNIDTQGNFSLSGTYEVTEATYNFSLYNVLKKDFEVEPGGRITWYGNPYEGIMDLTARYTETVSIEPLLARSSTSTQDQSSSLARRRFPVDVIMELDGKLLSPDFKFGFDFSNFPTSSGEIQTAISAFQNRIANDEQEMNRQVFSVIMTRSFSPEGQFAGVNSFSNSLGQLLSSQLNNFLGQVDKNLEINIDLASLDQNALETFQLSVAYTFLDGRLRVSRDGGFTDNRGQAVATSIIGDWQAEYLLTEDGVYRIRIFNRNNFNTFTSLSLSKNVATYGVAVSQNVSFNSIGELFQKITRKKSRENQLHEDSDNFLRYSQEDWTPINLDNIEERLDSLKNTQNQFLYRKEEDQ
ncbi:translocation/assembly module TamB domain-containing protein [Algoriphagus sp. CAU 1675]|uniref:translocation/assembly module TamB domain-containing protein n=1 Tax=Algoriphagus sp. CAU 1675 TaxID=3032597 RepID=UPI0023DA7363|nr:translocation/assembly module TamB domain-containing protein [Algoriphagus sp. CAU 1675]MDF2157190.1 translocation/assembly module TamB domain-containing protein [Algoriphagus sp. CAU 1675]